MSIDLEKLPDNLAALKAIIASQSAQLKARDEQIKAQKFQVKDRDFQIGVLEELLRYANFRKFASSSERWEGQRLLFDEAEDHKTDKHRADDKKTITYQRGTPKRKPIPEFFKRINIEYDLDA